MTNYDKINEGSEKMNKVKIILITIFAIVGALLIYKHFEKLKSNDDEINLFASEYTLVPEENIFVYSTIDEILSVFNSKTGIIFLCTPDSSWCQYYAKYLNETLTDAGIDKIYYLNIKDERDMNTAKYQKLLEILENYVYKDDSNNTMIFMPDLTFVRNGVIVAHDNDTSLIASDVIASEYYNQNKINEFKNKMYEYVGLMNKEEEIGENE